MRQSSCTSISEYHTRKNDALAGNGEKMAEKNVTKVMIDGKIITLGGYESEEYLQRVANYVNHKITEMESMTSFRRMSPDMRFCMMAINITDDYFKAKEQADAAEQ